MKRKIQAALFITREITCFVTKLEVECIEIKPTGHQCRIGKLPVYRVLQFLSAQKEF